MQEWISLIDAVLIGIGVLYILTESKSYTLTLLIELDTEGSIPAWYSSAKLLLVAVLLACLSTAIAPPGRFNLAVVLAALFFLLMSCDETVQLHELAQIIITRFMGGDAFRPGDPNLPLITVLVVVPMLLVGVLVLRAAVSGHAGVGSGSGLMPSSA